jgi:hypothetical protein
MKMKRNMSKTKPVNLCVIAIIIMALSAPAFASACDCESKEPINENEINEINKGKNELELDRMGNTRILSNILEYDTQEQILLIAGVWAKASATAGFESGYENVPSTMEKSCNLDPDGGLCEEPLPLPIFATMTKQTTLRYASATTNVESAVVKAEATIDTLSISSNLTGDFSTVAFDSSTPCGQGESCADCAVTQDAHATSRIESKGPQDYKMEIPFNVTMDCVLVCDANLTVFGTNEDIEGDATVIWKIVRYGVIANGEITVEDLGSYNDTWVYNINANDDYELIVEYDFSHSLGSCAACCYPADSNFGDIRHNFTVDIAFYDPSCPGDVNGDGVVDVLDLLLVLAAWGNPGGPEDINGDGIVDVLDLLEVLANWGPC